DPKLSERDIRSYLGGFNFRGDKVLQAVKTFSGGQKARLVLALLIWSRPNLLLLDEPTNHLDLEMRLALNQALQGFDGSVILVSHDRHLLRSVCDDLWLVDGGMLQHFEQDLDYYPSWLAQRKSRGENSSAPAVVSHPQTRRRQKFQLNQLNRIEKKLAKLNALQESLEQKLEDSSIYDDKNRDQLNANLAEQAENRKLLDQAEEDWLRLSESIEQQAN
ncbi:MAG: ATP-binding cassette domain-containing protein, partial [Gammaproteobacteria bacterium]|nr:ATP-binding cassette domain-containing protein [Gammaproteobacteria bacterium]